VGPSQKTGGSPQDLVLHCAGHDFDSVLTAKTGNLKAAMDAMTMRTSKAP
jgi:hypothetical protein